MKYLKYIATVMALLWIVHMTYSAELTVKEITALNANTINVSLSENPNLAVWEIEAEIRVLNDIKMRAAILQEGETKKVEILLEDPILPSTSYSLLTVAWADGSIDFETPMSVEGFSANNISSIELQDIESIEIIDDRTMIIEYREDLIEEVFDYKLLAESKVVKVEKPDYYLSDLQITIDPPLISEKDYILMFIEIQDEGWDYLEFDTGIYDFTTPIIESMDSDTESTGTGDILEENTDIPENTMNQDDELQVVTVETENTDSETQTWSLNSVELNAAGDEVSLEKDSEGELTTLEAANQVNETPDTWAETWVIIIATLVINSFYYLSRRKKQVLV